MGKELRKRRSFSSRLWIPSRIYAYDVVLLERGNSFTIGGDVCQEVVNMMDPNMKITSFS